MKINIVKMLLQLLWQFMANTTDLFYLLQAFLKVPRQFSLLMCLSSSSSFIIMSEHVYKAIKT